MSHIPVLINEVLAGLDPKEGGKFIDATIGSGGHSAALLARIGKTGKLLGIDRDPNAIARLTQTDLGRDPRVTLAHSSYLDIETLAKQYDMAEVDGILFDLGYSSTQVDDAQRGFSMRSDGPLDMRFDPCHTETTAASFINSANAKTLERILREYGEEPRARQIAEAIVQQRRKSRIVGTQELAQIVRSIYGRARMKIDPATRTFQALRIAVNDELDQLVQALPRALDLLKVGGRIAVITFHSLEDRIAKNVFRASADAHIVELLTKKPIVPTVQEITHNPRSRSAKLRVAVKLPT